MPAALQRHGGVREMTQITLAKLISQGATLTDEQKDSLYELVSSRCRQATKENLRRMINLPLTLWENCGRFDRVHLESNGRFSYCAGQDYPAEIRGLRNLILGRM